MDTASISLLIGIISFFIGIVTLSILGFTQKDYVSPTDTLLIVIVVSVAFTAYLAMYLQLATLEINGVQVQIARYVDWIITTPLLLLSLLILGLPKDYPGRSTIISIIVALDVYMILTGALAAISQTDNSKWLWFSLSTVAFLLVAFFLVYTLLSSSSGQPLVLGLMGYLLALWLGYPIVWLLSPAGTKVIDFGLENVLYVILDVLAKFGFGIFLMLILIYTGQSLCSPANLQNTDLLI